MIQLQFYSIGYWQSYRTTCLATNCSLSKFKIFTSRYCIFFAIKWNEWYSNGMEFNRRIIEIQRLFICLYLFIHSKLNVLLLKVHHDSWWFLYLSFHIKNSKKHFILFNTIYLWYLGVSHLFRKKYNSYRHS